MILTLNNPRSLITDKFLPFNPSDFYENYKSDSPFFGENMETVWENFIPGRQ